MSRKNAERTVVPWLYPPCQRLNPPLRPRPPALAAPLAPDGRTPFSIYRLAGHIRSQLRGSGNHSDSVPDSAQARRPVRGQLDTLGALALGLLVAGILLFASEGARVKWDAALALVGAGGGAMGLLILVARQLTADSPFIPREFLRNYRFLALTAMSFSVMAASLATLIGLPLLLTTAASAVVAGGGIDAAAQCSPGLWAGLVGRAHNRSEGSSSSSQGRSSHDADCRGRALNPCWLNSLGYRFVCRAIGAVDSG